MSQELKTKVSLKQEEEMIYKCDLGRTNMQQLYIDEHHKNSSKKIGPTPTKLLALSILGCLAASFEFCLQKKDLSLSDLDGIAEVTITRNDKGFWRIKKIDINIIPKIDNHKIHQRVIQCKKFFEKYCIILESIREGFEVNVNLDY